MSATESALRPASPKDFPYFRSLWNTVVAALLGASFIPLIVLGGATYFYNTSVLKQQTLDALRQKVLYHRKAIDRFLAERTRDLQLVSQRIDVSSPALQATLQETYDSLQGGMPCFTDLGIIDEEGNHLAYVGPYDLMAKNYKQAPWFQMVMKEGVHISDMFLGYRNVPHFIIAVKPSAQNIPWIIRATIDSEFFGSLVSNVSESRRTDAYLVNREGIFQTQPRYAGELMQPSDFRDLAYFDGVKLEERGDHIRASVWQVNVLWLNVVQTERKEILAPLRRVRYIGFFAFVLGGLLIVPTVLLSTNHLVLRLETKRQNLRFLDRQLQHASKAASASRLSSGALEDIKENLANMDAASQWMRELLRRKQTEEGQKEIQETLAQIEGELRRCRTAVDRCIDLTRPSAGPVFLEVNVNQLLDDLVELLQRQLRFNRIRVTRDYQDPLPPMRSDPSGLRQVFQNLVLNAMAAIRQDGEIFLKTRATADRMQVTITDDGAGIPEANLEKIFDPLFTTKPEGMGLGLSISRSILEKLGGTISARNEPGKGATVLVGLPLTFQNSNLRPL